MKKRKGEQPTKQLLKGGVQDQAEELKNSKKY